MNVSYATCNCTALPWGWLNWIHFRAGDYESVFGGLPGQLDHIPLFPRGELAKHNLLEVYMWSNSSLDVNFLSQGIHILNKVTPRVAMWLRGEGDLKVAFFLFCPRQLMTMIISPCPNTMIQCLLLQVNWDILTEGYTHHTQEPRTVQVKKWQLKNVKNVALFWDVFTPLCRS